MGRTAQGEVQEVRQLPVRLPAAEYDALKTYAFFTKTSMNDVIARAVAAYLAAHGDDEFDAIVGKAQSDFRQALDKLASL